MFQKSCFLGGLIGSRLFFYGLLLLVGVSSRAKTSLYTLTEDVHVMTQKRMITLQGARAGEGYFSKDGKWMVFQGERDSNNPFYQIYLMNLKTGKTERVSNGEGQTTCSWIHPDQRKVLFSSTHLDPSWQEKAKKEWERRKAQQKAKYSWDYDEYYDIFSWDRLTKKYKQLTFESGYDAEASYSPDGRWIVFASNRHQDADLTPEDRKIFSQDPSYLMEIYKMRSDGSQVKRLTYSKGYDGGPFFSFDGKKITWRRFSTSGQTAEIYVMNTDGSDQKSITDLKAMSWAPFFHPSGKYIIFTSNLLGYSNFELFIVDVAGKRQPVRVSFMDGFDGLPVFTPDGKHLSWTHQNEKGESQIWMADWNDELAQDLLQINETQPRALDYHPKIRISDIKHSLRYLSSPEMEGRPTGSPAETKYVQWISSLFKSWGIPVFVQEFEFVSAVELGEHNTLSATDSPKKLGSDFMPFSFSKSGTFTQAPVAFAGFGMAVPATPTQAAYDSYQGLDVKGRWVIAFRDIPEEISNERKIFLNAYARPYHKAMAAEMAQAVGLLLVDTQSSSLSGVTPVLKYEGGAESRIPVLSISQDFANQLLQGSGRNLTKWMEVLNKGEVQGALLDQKVKLSTQVELHYKKSKGHNVVGWIKAPNKDSHRTLVLGAHGDHLGHGEFGNSLAKANEKGDIHYGADDNASGVSAIIELAHYFKQNSIKHPTQMKHNILLGIWSGEELGVLGSNSFLKNIPKGLGISKENIFAYLNLDMVGRYRDLLQVQGVQSASEWMALLEPFAVSSHLTLNFQKDPYVPTDSLAFYMNEIPTLTFFTGSHEQYHSPRDRSYLIEWEGLRRVTEFVKDIALNLSGRSEIPIHYQKVEGGRDLNRSRSFRIYLGTIPDYTQDGVKGVKISGTSQDSPAHKAGLQAGDIIVEIGGTKIENLYDYVYKLQTMKANQTVGVKVVRAQSDPSKEEGVRELQITPVLKE